VSSEPPSLSMQIAPTGHTISQTRQRMQSTSRDGSTTTLPPLSVQYEKTFVGHAEMHFSQP
jgi:hypothetical protein